MTTYTRHCDADDIYWCAFHGALDFLGNGITTAYDFTDSRLPLAMDAMDGGCMAGPLKLFAHVDRADFRAKIEAGLRFINSVQLNDELGDDGGDFRALRGDASPMRRRVSPKRRSTSARRSRARRMVDRSRGRTTGSQRRCGGSTSSTNRIFSKPRRQARLPAFEMERSTRRRRARPEPIFRPFRTGDEEMIAEAGALRLRHGRGSRPRMVASLRASPTSAPASTPASMSASGSTTNPAPTFPTPAEHALRHLLAARERQEPGAMGVAEMLRLHTLGSAEALGDRRPRSAVWRSGEIRGFPGRGSPRQPDIGPVWDRDRRPMCWPAASAI